jgi:ADP-heptose:LPS heptosyltransferase
MTPQFTLVHEPVECSPCFLRKCPIDHRCMTRISVERVFEAAQSLMIAGDRAKSSSVWSQRLA